MDKLYIAWYIFIFVVLFAANIYIANNFSKFYENPCKPFCVNGYQYLVCGTFKTGVVQMMEGDGEEIFLVKCEN